MPSQTMRKLENLGKRAFDEPMTGELIQEELQSITTAEPLHPMPLLAQAIILGMGRKDLSKMKEFLSQVAQLIVKNSGQEASDDWLAAKMLYDILSAETILVEHRSTRDRPDRPEDTALREQAASKMNEALARLEQYAKERENMMLFRVLVPALRALSLANQPDSDKAQSGIATLEHISRITEPLSSLAAYFLIFAYRRDHKTNDAVRIASTLLQRHPRGIIPKLALASAHAVAGDYLKAELLVREVSELLPKDNWLSLGRAVLLRRANRIDEARAVLECIQAGSEQMRLKTFLDIEKRIIRPRVITPPH